MRLLSAASLEAFHVPHGVFFAEAMPLLGAALTLRALDGGDLLMLRSLRDDSAEPVRTRRR